MNFTSFDQVLNSGALTPAPARDVATTAAPAAGFQPLFSPGGMAAVQSERAAHGESQIELVQENGRIVRIVVTCGCGEKTVLDCAY